jgi:hypothetical protein
MIRSLQKAEVDIPIFNGESSLAGKWTFIYAKGSQWSPYPSVGPENMAALIERELATRRMHNFSLNSPLIFRQTQHFILAFPSNSITGRQEFYHGLTIEKIDVSNVLEKARVDSCLRSRVEAMKMAMSKEPLVYGVENVETMRGGRMPLMDGFGSVMMPFSRVAKEFGDGTLRVHYWEERAVPLK